MQQLTLGAKGIGNAVVAASPTGENRAEAEALIREFCDEAYSEALRREREANSNEIAKDWSRVALAVAHKMRRRVGVDPSTRIAMNALFVADREPAAARLPRGYTQHSQRGRRCRGRLDVSAGPSSSPGGPGRSSLNTSARTGE